MKMSMKNVHEIDASHSWGGGHKGPSLTFLQSYDNFLLSFELTYGLKVLGME